MTSTNAPTPRPPAQPNTSPRRTAGNHRRGLSPDAQSPLPDNLAVDYIFLRKAIGIIAVLLPVILLVGKWSLDHEWSPEESMSHFYYTHSRNFFVGSLCAQAVFLFSYCYGATGKFKADNYASDLAAAATLGVAFLPTTRNQNASTAEQVVGVLHLVCAAVLFVVLGIFAVYFFRMSDGPITQEKVQRNRVYLACGCIIFGCLLLVVLSEFVTLPDSWHALFALETAMVWAFGVSWLLKAGFLGVLTDKQTGMQAGKPADKQAGKASREAS